MQELKLIKEANTDYLKKYNRYESVMGNNAFQIDWMIGNTCNYACTYCDDNFHDGSVPWPDVDTTVKFIKKLERPITLENIKKIKELSHLSLIKQSRLSVMPIDAKSWKILNNMGKI